MKKKRLIIGGIGIILGTTLGLLTTVARRRSIVSPLKIRVDTAGNGNFGTNRTPPYGKHYGIDLVVTEFQKVYAPFKGTVTIIENAITNKKGYKGVRIFAEDNLQIDVLYISPVVKNNAVVKKGEMIGYAQDITQAYPGQAMFNHIHIEHYDRSKSIFLNPTEYYFGSIFTASASESFLEISPEEYKKYVAHQFE